jgi:hypothetical protein
MKNIAKQTHYENASKDFKTADEQILDDETVNKMREKFTMTNLDSRVEDALPIINRIMSELDLKDLKPKASDVITYGKGGSLKYIQIEYEILGTLENMLINNSEQEVLKRIADFVTDEVGEEHVDKAMEIIQKAKENKDEEMTFDDMIEQLKGKKEEQVNELDPGDEPIDAPIQAPVDHGAVVQSFLTDPENKLVLRKDPTADKMLSATKFTDKNTMLGSILSDIASRLLTKSGEEDRVANFASRVADGIEQEGSNSFKPGPDYNSNKKIAVQLAKRYIDDYKKMQQDPAYADEVRMDPADFSPKKNIKGKAIGKEAEEFVEWAEQTANEYATPKDDEDRKAKMKAIQDLQMDPNTSKDPELQAEIQKRKKELGMTTEENQLEGLTFEDIKPYVSMYTDKDGKKVNAVLDKDGEEVFKTHDAKAAMAYLSQNYNKLKEQDSEVQDEGNAYSGAVAKAKMNGMKKGDKVKGPDGDEITLEEVPAEAQEEAEEINTELDRIKQLANIQ